MSNRTNALNTIKQYTSTHAANSGYLYLDFNIKVYESLPIDGIDIFARLDEYEEGIALNLAFEGELEMLIEYVNSLEVNIGNEPTAPLAVFTEGRSGGWLVVKFPVPKAPDDLVTVAEFINKVQKYIDDRLDALTTVEYWQEFVKDNFLPLPHVTSIVVYGVGRGGSITFVRGDKAKSYFFNLRNLNRLNTLKQKGIIQVEDAHYVTIDLPIVRYTTGA